jgi:putative transposase
MGYLYSSARYRVGIVKEDNVLSTNDMIDSIENYRDFLKIEPEEIEVIKEKTRTGRPCGDDLFYEHIKLKFGKDLKPKKAGRPRKDK